MSLLPRPPAHNDPRMWGIWFDAVYKILSGIVGLAWTAIDKTGSKLADIITRPHSDLQNIEAADVTSSDTTADRHITDALAKSWTDDIDALQTVPVDTLDPTGWIDPAAITVTYNDTADTITLTGTLDYYWRGVKRSLTSPWTSTAHSATTGQSYFLSSSDGTNFTWSTSIWAFSDLMVAAVQHGATDLFAIREVHGCNMSWTVHEEFHRTTGTYKQSGGTLAGYTLASTTPAFRRPSVSACFVHDEDIETTIAALPDDGPYTQVTLTGSGVTTFTKSAAEIVPVLGNNPYYNSFTTPNWTQTLMANNSYMSIWLVAVPTAEGTESQQYRFLWIQGQTNGSLVTQQALQPQDLNLGSLTTLAAEFVFIAKVIIRYQGGNWDFTSVTNLTGSRAFSVGSPAGLYLSTVAVDGVTITGDGTVGNPLVSAASGGSPITSPDGLKSITVDNAGIRGVGVTEWRSSSSVTDYNYLSVTAADASINSIDSVNGSAYLTASAGAISAQCDLTGSFTALGGLSFFGGAILYVDPVAGFVAYDESNANTIALTAAGMDVTAPYLKLNGVEVGGGSVSATQVEIDFGATPMSDKLFTITDATVSATSKIVATVAYEDTTDNTADEASELQITVGKPAAGSFTVMGFSPTSLLRGKFKINYIVG